MLSEDPATSNSTIENYPGWAVAVRNNCPPATKEEYLSEWREFFDHFAPMIDDWHGRNRGYHYSINRLMKFYVAPGARVLEVGCATGDLLASLKPSFGVGVVPLPGDDQKGEGKASGVGVSPDGCRGPKPGKGKKFDYIVLSDMVGFFFDIKLVLEQLRKVCHADTRIIIHWYSRLWQPILNLAEKTGLKYPQPLINWTTAADISNLLYLADYDVVTAESSSCCPSASR